MYAEMKTRGSGTKSSRGRMVVHDVATAVPKINREDIFPLDEDDNSKIGSEVSVTATRNVTEV